MFCIEARGLYIIVQTAPGERMRRSRRRMESEFRSTVMAEEHAGGTQREWAERGQKVSTPLLQHPKEVQDAGEWSR